MNEHSELWDAYFANRTLENRNALVAANMGLVYRHTRKIKSRVFDDNELDNMAVPGLIRAIERYDPSTGNKFSTFAEWEIKGPFWRALKKARPAATTPFTPLNEPADNAEWTRMADASLDFTEVQKCLHLLNEPQRIYLAMVMRGLNGTEIAKILNVTKARVSQMKYEITGLLKPVFFCED